jgi:hypothetical protein
MSKSLVLKVVSPEMKSYGGFQWSGVGGKVTAPDWAPTRACGKGLHGWLNGVGDIGCQSFTDQLGAIWLVLAVDTDKIIDLGRKVKFPEAEVLFTGSMIDAARFIAEETGFTGPIIGIHRTGGYGSTLTGGDYSTLTGGATPRSQVETTPRSQVALTTPRSQVVTVPRSQVANTPRSQVVAVPRSQVATVPRSQVATVLHAHRWRLLHAHRWLRFHAHRWRWYSTLTGGYGSTLIGGDESILQLTYYNARMRIATAYVGEDGIKPNVPYKLDENHNFVEVKDA